MLRRTHGTRRNQRAAAGDRIDTETEAVATSRSDRQGDEPNCVDVRRALGPVYCAHNTWYLWGPLRDPVAVAIVVGGSTQALAELFETVEPAGVYRHDHVMPWRDNTPVWIVRSVRAELQARLASR